MAEFEAMTPEQQRAYARKLLELWEKNDELQRQRDDDFDDRRGNEWS